MKYSDYLYHHGVKGQKWGKRNGPPYPLGSGQASAAEKKEGWKESRFIIGSEDKKDIKRTRIGGNEEKSWLERRREKEKDKEELKEKKRLEKERKEEEARLEKERKEEEARLEKERKEEEVREGIIARADIDEIMKNADKLTTEELAEAKRRVQELQNIRDIRKNSIYDTGNKVLNTTKGIVDLARSGVDLASKAKEFSSKYLEKSKSSEEISNILDSLNKNPKITEEERSSKLQRAVDLFNLERLSKGDTPINNPYNPKSNDKNDPPSKAEEKVSEMLSEYMKNSSKISPEEREGLINEARDIINLDRLSKGKDIYNNNNKNNKNHKSPVITKASIDEAFKDKDSSNEKEEKKEKKKIKFPFKK